MKIQSNTVYCDCCGSVIPDYYATLNMVYKHARVDTEELETLYGVMKMDVTEEYDSDMDICSTCWKVVEHFLKLRKEDVKSLHSLINYLADERGDINV